MSEACILRLPHEILAEIFRQYLPGSLEGCAASNRTPLFLGKVCATWRSVAWSTSDLWSSVSVVLSQDGLNLKVQVELLGEWLARSGCCPLSICIGITTQTLWVSHSPADVVRVVAQYMARWRHVDFALPHRCFHEFTDKRDQLPLLTSVVIRPTLDFPGSNGGRIVATVGASMLVPWYRLSISRIAFPWQQLLKFSGIKLPLNDCLAVILQAQDLTHIDIRLSLDWNSDIMDHPILVPHLKSLVVDGSDRHVVLSFLAKITAPALSELTISTQENIARDLNDTLLSFFSRSVCRVRRLLLKTMLNINMQLIRCLRMMSSLVELEMGTELRLGNYPIEQMILPNLKSFVMNYSKNMPESGGILDVMTLPSAEHISLLGNLGEMETILDAPFLGFLVHSSQTLQCLCLKNFVITAPQLFQYLRYVPSLVELKLENIRQDRLKRWSRTDVIPLLNLRVLPNLRVFEYRDAPEFDGSMLQKMLSSRWQSEKRVEGGGKEYKTVRLDSVMIEIQRDQRQYLSEEVISGLQVLIGEGLKISVTNVSGTKYL